MVLPITAERQTCKYFKSSSDAWHVIERNWTEFNINLNTNIWPPKDSCNNINLDTNIWPPNLHPPILLLVSYSSGGWRLSASQHEGLHSPTDFLPNLNLLSLHLKMKPKFRSHLPLKVNLGVNSVEIRINKSEHQIKRNLSLLDVKKQKNKSE